MMNKELFNNPYTFLVIALVLFLPVFLINLGDQPIIEDEAIRSLVAFEMHKSGDYITPTIGGDQYLRKPPLYNWLIAASFTLTGNYNETSIRLPMIISLFLFGLSIFLLIKKELGTKMGAINALIFITLGRIVFFESLHGLIDIAFSWLTYLFFMLSYFFFKDKKYLSLFVTAYIITSITWLMKGLPSLVFLGTSLLVLFISNKKFKVLFSWKHFAGIFIFLLIIGIYYLIYFSRNDVSPQELFQTLLGQTTRRTAIRFGWWITIKHLFIFPFEMFYHFLPWSILVLVFFVKDARKRIFSHPFLKYNFLLLVFNVIVYWTSPEVHPRYILMLTPLFFTLVTWIYFKEKNNNNKMIRIPEYIFGLLLIMSCIAPYASLFIEETKNIDHIWLITILFFLSMVTLTFFYWKKVLMRLFWLSVAILVIRLGFDFIILPTRQLNTNEVEGKESAFELAKQTKEMPLVLYWNPDFEPSFYDKRNIIRNRYLYWLSVARDEMITIHLEINPDTIYIADENHIADRPVSIIGSFDQKLDDTKTLKLVTLSGD